jgi:hypothetical protein
MGQFEKTQDIVFKKLPDPGQKKVKLFSHTAVDGTPLPAY